MAHAVPTLLPVLLATLAVRPEGDPVDELARALELKVLVAEALPAPEAPVLARIRSRLDGDLPLAEARTYIGLAVHPKTLRDTELRFVSVPLGEGEGRLYAASEEGELLALSVVGSAAFDDDPLQAWSSFLGGLRRAVRTIEDDDAVERWRELAPHLAEPADDEASRLAAALATQYQMMRQNNVVLGAVGRLSSEDRMPPSDWLDRPVRMAEELVARSPDLAPVFGEEGAARHAEAARLLADNLNATRAAAERGDPALLHEALVAGDALCARCHQADAPGGNESWMSAARGARARIDLPWGVLRVGYDVAAAPGDDGALSQRVADALHAGWLLLENARTP